MLDFTKFWDPSYLFGRNPALLSRSDNIFLWAGATFIAICVIAKILALRSDKQNPTRFLFNRLFHNFLTMGLLVLIWSGFRYENIPWLSTHIVILVLFLIWLIWIIFIVKYALSEYPKQKKIWQEEKVKRKYLP